MARYWPSSFAIVFACLWTKTESGSNETRKKRTRPISSHFDRKSWVNKEFISCLFICCISGYGTIRHVFGIDHASRCSKSKRTKWQKLLIELEHKEFLLSFGCLETSKRDFVSTPRKELRTRFCENGTEK